MKTSESKVDLESILRRVRGGEIDLQPNFQRGEVWDKKRQQRLIDTILRGWYLPAIQLVVENDDATESVLDGQQRLVAIRDFFDAKFPVDGNIKPSDDYIKKLDGLFFPDLPPVVQRRLQRFEVSQVRLTDHEPSEPSELFFRLNQAYALTPSEKRNALYGAPRDQVRYLVAELTRGLLQREVVGFSNGRLAFDDVVSRVCVSLESNTLRRHVNNATVEDRYRDGRPFPEWVLERVRLGAKILQKQIEMTPSSRVKFNKGTLQSWLVFMAVNAKGAVVVPDELLAAFEADKSGLRSDGVSISSDEYQKITFTILSIYGDRASYRVTDVSSVVLRDLCIHAYMCVQFGVVADDRIKDIIDILRESEPNAANVVLEYVGNSDWAAYLLSEGAR